jgi:hypothetical protein
MSAPGKNRMDVLTDMGTGNLLCRTMSKVLDPSATWQGTDRLLDLIPQESLVLGTAGACAVRERSHSICHSRPRLISRLNLPWSAAHSLTS